MKKIWTLLMCLLSVFVLPAAVLAEEGAKLDTGDTGFMIVSTAFVLFMTPGLALFYGGMVRKKNVLSTTMQSFIAMAIASILWILVGFSLAFGSDHYGLIGSLEWVGLNNVGIEPNPDYAATVPFIIFMAFQMKFAIITPALISGSVAERMRFPAFLVFLVVWLFVVYFPLAHWVWGVGGFLRTLGALDFAGGTVVHISSGVSGLVAALMLGKRKGFGRESMTPHNIPYTVLGTGLLWFGWFGFNAGSALSANGLAGIALVTTNTSAAAATISWMAAEWLHRGKPTVLGAASGAVAGLVAITPAAGFVTPMSSILIGLVGGVICYFAVSVLKAKLGYDDALDAFGVHGIGGTWGALATGIFATTTVNTAGLDGMLYGNVAQLGIQAASIGITVILAGSATFLILKGIGLFTSLRATEEEEELGLDLSMHGEEAYPDFVGSGFSAMTGLHATPIKGHEGQRDMAIKSV